MGQGIDVSSRVLIVDDDVDLLETLDRLLRRSGYNCLTASSGRDGIRVIDAQSPDLVVTDLHMSGLDGLAVIRHACAQVPRIPVVLMTAYPSPASQDQARQAGATIHLAKPFSNAAFLAAVQQALRA